MIESKRDQISILALNILISSKKNIQIMKFTKSVHIFFSAVKNNHQNDNFFIVLIKN